jgi:hypothetical protein
MSGNETVNPHFLPPVIEVFFKALILAEEENAPEIGVDHLLTALDSSTTRTEPVAQSMGPFVPTPHRDKPLFSEAKTAIQAAGTSRCQAQSTKVTDTHSGQRNACFQKAVISRGRRRIRLSVRRAASPNCQ